MSQNIKVAIQKMLELSKRTTFAEESQSALLMAQRMAIKHNISLADLGVLPPSENKDIVHVEVRREGLSSWWREDLLPIIGNNFKCESYRSLTRVANGKKFYRLMLVGFREDVDIATAVFQHAEKSVAFHALDYIRKMGRRIKSANKNKFKNEFIKGYLDGLSRKFKEQVQAEGWGLVLVKDALVLKATSHMEKYTISTPDMVSTGANAYAKGFEKGKVYGYPSGFLEGK
ncbi:hypothetical protein AV654_19720 [Paenibacillus elgii]|uniref:Uncharacterized protein n=1 Tax=Paenibacillus elgii TaxID=189691 RepID=A0A163XP37_9BACL|nr:DUF2786 domain-containing protein [Paenibacillus elgii]KZE78206.1 hypothetical protein AV654_19720 [Paenibacillus elgii]